MLHLLSRYFSRRFGRKRPTSDWKRDPSVALSVDLDTGRFCGLLPGCQLERLWFLGPSAEPALHEPENLCGYPSLGVQLFLTQDGRIDGFDINTWAEPGWAAFAGSWVCRGESVAVDASVTPARLQELLGAPTRRSEGGVLYARSGSDLWFEWDDAGRLANVLLDEPASNPARKAP